MALNLDTLKNIPNNQKMVLLGLLLVVIIGGFIYFFVVPKRQEIAVLEQANTGLAQEIQTNKIKVRKLEELKRQNLILLADLAKLQEQLPAEEEVARLLKQVSDLGVGIGLEMKLWKPSEKKADPNGLYTEIPVDVEVAGGYHAVAVFFDGISKLSRIVTVSGLKMTNPHLQKNRFVIQTTFRATAYAAAKPAPPSEAGGGPNKTGTLPMPGGRSKT